MTEGRQSTYEMAFTHFIVSRDVERSVRFLYRGPRRHDYPLRSAVLGGLANSWIIINVGGGPTDDKPTVTLEPPPDLDRTSACSSTSGSPISGLRMQTGGARGAEFLTPPKRASNGDALLRPGSRRPPDRGRPNHPARRLVTVFDQVLRHFRRPRGCRPSWPRVTPTSAKLGRRHPGRTGGSWTTWLPPALPNDTVRNRVTVPPPDAGFSSSGGIATRTGGSWTTWLPPALPNGTVRNQVTVPPPDPRFSSSGGICNPNWWRLDDRMLLALPNGTVRNQVTVPPPDAGFSSSGGIATRTGGSWTTWSPPALPNGTVRNQVTVPPPDAGFSFLRRHLQPEQVVVGRPGCRRRCQTTPFATGSPFRHQMPALYF